MGKVVMHNVVSVDGFIADDNDDVGPLFEWYFNGDHPLTAQDMADPEPGGMRSRRPPSTTCGRCGTHRRDGDRPAPVRHDQRLGGQAARRATTWSWCRTGRSPRDGTRRRRTTSSTTSPRRWRRPRSSPATARRRRGRRRRGPGARGRAGGRGGDGRGAGGVRLRQAVLRSGRRPAPARGPGGGRPGRPGAAPALPGAPLRSAAARTHRDWTRFPCVTDAHRCAPPLGGGRPAARRAHRPHPADHRRRRRPARRVLLPGLRPVEVLPVLQPDAAAVRSATWSGSPTSTTPTGWRWCCCSRAG